MDRLIMQVDFCQIVHVMPKLRLEYIMCHHGIKESASDFNAIVLKNEHVILYVLSNLE